MKIKCPSCGENLYQIYISTGKGYINLTKKEKTGYCFKCGFLKIKSVEYEII